MRKWYKKIGWLVNGVMIGIIIAGLVHGNFTTFVIGGLAGLAVAVGLKTVSWLRQRSLG
jgi:hypothetical protein